MHRSTVRLVAYLAMIAAASLVSACLLTPLLPYPFPKILRRAATVCAALSLPYFVTRVQRWSWRSLGLERSSRMARQLLQGVGGGALLFGALLGVLTWAGAMRWYWPTPAGWWSLLGFLPAAAVIALLEETFFRGVVMQSLLADLGVVAAVLLSSACYAVLHFVKYLAHPLQILPELFGLFLFGCVLASAYLRTKLLACSIGLHLSAAYLAKVDRHFLEFTGREPRWLFGTDRWLTGLVGWGILAIALALIIGSPRRGRGESTP